MTDLKNLTEVTLSHVSFDAKHIPAKSGAVPVPALDGKRVTTTKPGGPIYWVWNGGYRCHIPNVPTYWNLFSTDKGIIPLNLDGIAEGPPLTNGALMASYAGSPLYLITNSQKHGVASPAVQEYCKLSGGKQYNKVLIDSIPTGFSINYL